MKKIKLTQGKYALVDDADFEWLNQWKWHTSYYGYAERRQHLPSSRKNQKFKMIKMHRLILNTPDGLSTDHINHNKLDNRRSNLRICNVMQNLQNSQIRAHNKVGYKGVIRRQDKYIARIKVENRQIHLGTFETKEDAALSYNKAASKYFGEFAFPNEVTV